MLEVEVCLSENFDEETGEFLSEKVTLHLEHSLVSVSKWEAKYEKAFLTDVEKTPEEIIDYVRMMSLDDSISDDVYDCLTSESFESINSYIASKQTATWFHDKPKTNQPPTRETVTSELIYYWMLSYGLPMECQYWHLNRLFTLIRVFSVKNEKPKKHSASELAARNRALNAQRRAKLGTKG